jgi:site-specific recombinase XerD
VFQYQSQLDQYVTWMRNERGFSPFTVDQWSRIIGTFLRWCDKTNRQLRDLQPEDVDAYFVAQATGRWSRVSVANTASALRGFLRYAAKRGMCTDCLAVSICRPRLYRQESLPYAPDWCDVQRMLADAETDNPRDIRDRAILLLLPVYGMRSGEVAALRLDQIDWAGGTLRLFRLKRRQPQIYPLVPSAAEALAGYIDTVRPLSSCPEVFLCMQAPRRPLKAGSIYDVANRRFVALGIDAAMVSARSLDGFLRSLQHTWREGAMVEAMYSMRLMSSRSGANNLRHVWCRGCGNGARHHNDISDCGMITAMHNNIYSIISRRRTIGFVIVGLLSLSASFFVTSYLRAGLGVISMICASVWLQRATERWTKRHEADNG